MNHQGEILIYQNQQGKIKLDVQLQDETVWLNQIQIAQLFGKARSTVTEHITNVFKEGELFEEEVCRNFRQTTQHGAISQQTAAELVYRRVDASLPLMGMTSRDQSSSTSITKQQASIAKNYLNEDEIKLLGLLVEQYLAFAETMAQQQTPMTMQDWITRLDAILQLNGRELLTHAGKISQQQAKDKSALELETYREQQKAVQYEQSLKEIEADIKRLNHE